MNETKNKDFEKKINKHKSYYYLNKKIVFISNYIENYETRCEIDKIKYNEKNYNNLKQYNKEIKLFLNKTNFETLAKSDFKKIKSLNELILDEFKNLNENESLNTCHFALKMAIFGLNNMCS
ncbi:hypothetical protein [Methanosphaera sp.]